MASKRTNTHIDKRFLRQRIHHGIALIRSDDKKGLILREVNALNRFALSVRLFEALRSAKRRQLFDAHNAFAAQGPIQVLIIGTQIFNGRTTFMENVTCDFGGTVGQINIVCCGI